MSLVRSAPESDYDRLLLDGKDVRLAFHGAACQEIADGLAICFHLANVFW